METIRKTQTFKCLQFSVSNMSSNKPHCFSFLNSMYLLGVKTFPQKWQGPCPLRREPAAQGAAAGHRPGRCLRREQERCPSARCRRQGFEEEPNRVAPPPRARGGARGVRGPGCGPHGGCSEPCCLCLEGLGSTAFGGSGRRRSRLRAQPDLTLCASVFSLTFLKCFSEN